MNSKSQSLPLHCKTEILRAMHVWSINLIIFIRQSATTKVKRYKKHRSTMETKSMELKELVFNYWNFSPSQINKPVRSCIKHKLRLCTFIGIWDEKVIKPKPIDQKKIIKNEYMDDRIESVLERTISRHTIFNLDLGGSHGLTNTITAIWYSRQTRYFPVHLDQRPDGNPSLPLNGVAEQGDAW